MDPIRDGPVPPDFGRLCHIASQHSSRGLSRCCANFLTGQSVGGALPPAGPDTAHSRAALETSCKRSDDLPAFPALPLSSADQLSYFLRYPCSHAQENSVTCMKMVKGTPECRYRELGWKGFTRVKGQRVGHRSFVGMRGIRVKPYDVGL